MFLHESATTEIGTNSVYNCNRQEDRRKQQDPTLRIFAVDRTGKDRHCGPRSVRPEREMRQPRAGPGTCRRPSSNTLSHERLGDPPSPSIEGHKQDKPAGKVVTSAHSTIEPAPPSVKPEHLPAAARPHVDFAFLRQQVSLEMVLKHLDLLHHLRGSGPQRRGCCPVRSHPGDQERTFSVHLGKNAFRCFQKNCGVQGNALDLWAAIHRLPLYDAALHLAETFGVPRNREEEPVKGTR